MGVGAGLSRSEDVRLSPNPDQLCSSLISPRLRISWRQDVSSGGAPCCSLFLRGIRDLFATLGNPYNWPIATHHTGKTVAGVDLDSEADWNAALTKNVSRQTLYNNIIKEVFNSMTRIIGWALIALVLYGNLLSDSNRRKRSLESRRREEEKTFESVEMVHRFLHKSQNDGWQ